MKKQNLYLAFFFMVVFLVINIYSVSKYFIYTEVLNDNVNVNYSILSKKIHSGGRGQYFSMQVDSDNKIHNVSLTKAQFTEVEKGNLPKLFLTEDNELITNWNLIIAKRTSVISIIGFLISGITFFYLLLKKRKLNYF